MPKLDGTNGTLFLGDDGLVHAGSRNRELDQFKDNQGFYNRFTKDERFIEYFKKYPTHRLFGEYLKPHSLRTYEDDAWDKFYVFDVCEEIDDDANNGIRYIPYDEYVDSLEEFGIDYIPIITRIVNPTYDRLVDVMNHNKWMIQDGKGVNEGIVIKNYNYTNKYGRITWGKLISSEFNNGINHKGKVKSDNGKSNIEEKIVKRYLTEFVVDKEYSKIINENPDIEKRVLIPRLLNVCYYTLITEETWNFIKDFKNPVVDFKKIFKEVRNTVIKCKPDLFTK